MSENNNDRSGHVSPGVYITEREMPRINVRSINIDKDDNSRYDPQCTEFLETESLERIPSLQLPIRKEVVYSLEEARYFFNNAYGNDFCYAIDEDNLNIRGITNLIEAENFYNGHKNGFNILEFIYAYKKGCLKDSFVPKNFEDFEEKLFQFYNDIRENWLKENKIEPENNDKLKRKIIIKNE